MSKVYISKTKNIGKGIFARQNIRKGERIFVFEGKLVKFHYELDYKIGPKWLGIGKCLWLNTLKNSIGSFINHSCNPNAGFRGGRTVVAMKNIKKDEEITIDYSITEEDPFWKMNCKCESKNCRKIIKAIQFLPEKLFRKYHLFIPKYFYKSYIRKHENYS